MSADPQTLTIQIEVADLTGGEYGADAYRAWEVRWAIPATYDDRGVAYEATVRQEANNSPSYMMRSEYTGLEGRDIQGRMDLVSNTITVDIPLEDGNLREGRRLNRVELKTSSFSPVPTDTSPLPNPGFNDAKATNDDTGESSWVIGPQCDNAEVFRLPCPIYEDAPNDHTYLTGVDEVERQRRDRSTRALDLLSVGASSTPTGVALSVRVADLWSSPPRADGYGWTIFFSYRDRDWAVQAERYPEADIFRLGEVLSRGPLTWGVAVTGSMDVATQTVSVEIPRDLLGLRDGEDFRNVRAQSWYLLGRDTVSAFSQSDDAGWYGDPNYFGRYIIGTQCPA